MPAYDNSFPPYSISRGDQAQTWVPADGNLASGTKTQRVALADNPGGTPKRISWRITFSAAPGVISLQPQVADNDVDTEYVSEGAAIVAVSAAQVARAELVNITARFTRLLATTVTNTVTATVEATA